MMSIAVDHRHASEHSRALRARGFVPLPDKWPHKEYEAANIRRISGAKDFLQKAGLGHLVEEARTRITKDGVETCVWIPEWALVIWVSGDDHYPLQHELAVARRTAEDPELAQALATVFALGDRLAVRALVWATAEADTQDRSQSSLARVSAPKNDPA